MMTATDDYEEEPVTSVEMEDATPDNIDDATGTGAILEAAFVDPAYQWPPPDGQGKNAIELKASKSLMIDPNDDPDDAFRTQQRGEGNQGVKTTKTVIEDSSYRGFWCCKWNVKNQVHENIDTERFAVDDKGNIVEARESPEPPIASAVDEKQARKESRYGRVPEGILIYRLNTTTRKLELLSEPHSRTNTRKLVREMVIKKASPSSDKSRRGMNLVGEDGTKTTLVACEQRTAIAWLEVLDMMLNKNVSC